MKAFNRRCIVTVGNLRIDSLSSLRVAGSVTKTLKPEPNKAEVSITNLTRQHHNITVDQRPTIDIPVQIECGYCPDSNDDLSGVGVIFLGQLRDAGTSKENGTDFITRLESGDGERSMRRARINVSIAKGTTTDSVLRQVALAIGVGKGNLDDAARKIRSAFSGSGNIFTSGTVLSGSATREMDRICRSLGLQWSVQGGKLQILERGKALAATAVKLGEANGLTKASIDGKGILDFACPLHADINPGRLIVVDSLSVRGQFKVEEVVHTFDTDRRSDGVWTTEGKAKRY